jgi:hypothetical protein
MAVNRSELTVARPISFAAVSRAKNEDGIAASRYGHAGVSFPAAVSTGHSIQAVLADP